MTKNESHQLATLIHEAIRTARRDGIAISSQTRERHREMARANAAKANSDLWEAFYRLIPEACDE